MRCFRFAHIMCLSLVIYIMWFWLSGLFVGFLFDALGLIYSYRAKPCVSWRFGSIVDNKRLTSNKC